MSNFLSYVLIQTGILTVLLLICTIMERVAVIDRYPLRGRWIGIASNYLSLVGAIIIAWPLQQAWTHLGLAGRIVVPLADLVRPWGTAGSVLYIAVLLTATDFLRYWCHRAEHRWLWRYHAVHHAPTELHVANSAGHPLQAVPDLLMVSLPLSLIQFSGPGVPFIVSAIVVLMSMYIHSPIDIHAGPLRSLFVDNRFHRIHHSIEERHYDLNFGIGLSIWDRMFGTAYWPEKDEWPATGVAGLDPPRTISDFLMFPFKPMDQSNSRQDAADRVPLGVSLSTATAEK